MGISYPGAVAVFPEVFKIFFFRKVNLSSQNLILCTIFSSMTFQSLGNRTNVPNYVSLQQEQILIEVMPIANCHENMNIQ